MSNRRTSRQRSFVLPSKTLNRVSDYLISGNGLSINAKRRKISLAPLNRAPFARRNTAYDQRSFLSLGEPGEVYDEESAIDEDAGDVGDNESVSTFRSLPSTLEGTDDEIESMGRWLDEERERRSSSRTYGATDNDETDELLRQADLIFQRRSSYEGQVSRNADSEIGPLLLEESSEDEDFASEKATVGSESRKLARFSFPLIINFILEQIFSLVCVLFAGRLGKQELAAVSMASMVSAIVLAVFEGIATALDTLCPQAYGAGQLKNVGVQAQRCAAFSLVLFIPAAVFWWFSGLFLRFILSDEKVIRLTQQFLRVLIVGGPPYILFEDGKRFLQAQGIFDAGTWILFITAPFDVLLNWLLVYSKTFGMGYIGAAVAAVINFWLMFILLVLFVRYVDGSECWGGLTKAAFTHWGELSSFAIPGVIMLLAESMAYECMTLLSSYFGTDALASQSALASVVSLLYMVPFALSVASSTRIANFVGSGNISSAKIAVDVGMGSSLLSSVANSLFIFIFAWPIARLFTDDETVQKLIVSLCPLMALFVIFDGWGCIASGILRALGQQGMGGAINLVGYYFIAVPLSLFLGFNCHLELMGLWLGNGVGLLLIAVAETWIIYKADWKQVVAEAKERNEE